MKGFIIRFAFAEQVSVQPQTQLRRFFKEATVEMATNPTNPYHQWFVKLDNKLFKTPSRNTFAVPSPQLASCIAQEFNKQTEYINSSTMPLFELAKSAIDLDNDAKNREIIQTSIINQLERDNILYREEQGTELFQIQQQQLDPKLKIFNQRFGMTLNVNHGLDIEPLRLQDKVKMESMISSLNNWQLVSLDSKVENLKSTVLALLLWNNLIDTKLAIQLSQLDETYSLKQYGIIEEQENEENQIFIDIFASRLFAQLILSQSIVY